jgi:hypothetical protein
MSDQSSNFKVKSEWLETPFLIRQVESHLVFGPLSRYFPTGYVMLFCAASSLCLGVVATHKPIAQYIGSIADKLIFLFVPFILLRMTLRQQAIVGWMAVKGALGITGILCATVGAGVSFSRHQADALPNLFLGLIWIPGIEFIPRVTPHQRYVSIARVILSVPCIYFGIKSGNWHW